MSRNTCNVFYYIADWLATRVPEQSQVCHTYRKDRLLRNRFKGLPFQDIVQKKTVCRSLFCFTIMSGWQIISVSILQKWPNKKANTCITFYSICIMCSVSVTEQDEIQVASDGFLENECFDAVAGESGSVNWFSCVIFMNTTFPVKAWTEIISYTKLGACFSYLLT